jgi:hypothetical protein
MLFVRVRAKTLHPDETEMQKYLTAALNRVREGVAATKRTLLERCEMREDSEGQFHSIHDRMPDKTVTPGKSAA